MLALKGIIPRTAISSQTIDPIINKARETRKSSQLCLQFLTQLSKLQESHFKSYQIIACPTQQSNQYNRSLWNAIISIVHPQNPIFKLSNQTVEETAEVCNETFLYLSSKIAGLDQAIGQYKDEEDLVFEMARKYFKIQKSMITAIQMYKLSLTDVNLIYNMDEKTKRFLACENLYNSASHELKIINQTCQNLSIKKLNIFQTYSSLEEQSNKAVRKMGGIFIERVKEVMHQINQFSINTLSSISIFETNISNIELDRLLKLNVSQSKAQFFHAPEQIDVSKQLPLFVQYHELIKEQYLQNYNSEIEAYLKAVEEKLEQRKVLQKKLFDYVGNYFRNLQKIHCAGCKEILISFEKKRTKISECYGNRFITFLKSVNSVLQISAGLSENLIRTINPILSSIQKTLLDDAKIAKAFVEESKTNPERFLMKKLGNKNNKKQGLPIQIDADVESFMVRKQISEKANFMKYLMMGFIQKMDKNSLRIISHYNDIMIEMKNCTNELSTFCQEYSKMYFGVEQYQINLQKYRTDLETNLKRYNEYFCHLPLQQITKDKAKVVFNGEFSKIEDFKKIKKLVIDDKASNSDDKEVCGSETDQISLNKKASENWLQNVVDNEKETKHAEFLKTKITFKENEKLLKTSSCALSEKIILQGRLYLTSERICFYSNFNSQNIFFGRTFIQFPKSDIKKIQKRTNSFFLDNSMSFTTVNGQISFTSFFSRDETYDLICKAFNLSMDQHVYEYIVNDEAELPQFLIDYEESDDIKPTSLDLREVSIQKLINTYPYIDGSEIEISGEGLTAFKVFKIFYNDSQFLFKGRKYESFLKYQKDLIGQKDIDIQEWNPLLSNFMNKSNIKEDSPLSSTRKLNYTVPLANTGVPFMPKTAKAQEIQNLYFYSKHKFMIESTVATTGAPYTDTFKIELRTTVESSEDGKCKVSLKLYINFVKNTMMKSVIESRSKQETIASSKIRTTQIKNYFIDNLNKKKINKNNQTQQKTQSQDQQGVLDLLKQDNTVLKQKLGKAESSGKRWKLLSMASLLFNILLLVLLNVGLFNFDESL